MRASTEELLYFLMWTADPLLHPRWYGFSDSFEGWACRQGLGRRLQQLEAQKLLERQQKSGAGEGLFRLTAAGCVKALGGRNPLERWNRAWDGRWRLLVFDLPADATALRTRLRRYLLGHSFGYLQLSVWLTPDPLEDARRILAQFPESVEAFTLFEGRPCDSSTDADLVAGAWRFELLSERYELHRQVLAQCPLSAPPRNLAERTRLAAWARRELVAWKAAFELDPLLPRVLWPSDYAGWRAWEQRWALFARLTRG